MASVVKACSSHSPAPCSPAPSFLTPGAIIVSKCVCLFALVGRTGRGCDWCASPMRFQFARGTCVSNLRPGQDSKRPSPALCGWGRCKYVKQKCRKQCVHDFWSCLTRRGSHAGATIPRRTGGRPPEEWQRSHRLSERATTQGMAAPRLESQAANGETYPRNGRFK